MTAFNKTYRYLLILITSLLFNGSLIAKGNIATEAENRVLAVTTKVVKELAVNESRYKTDSVFLDNMIRKDMLPFIDFPAMAKLTLGKHWRKASALQRTNFTSAYREMLIRSYGKIMLKYSGAKIRGGNSVAGKKPGYVKVRTIVTPRGSAPITANYDVRNLSGDWKAYNVQVAGVNLITNFRTNFTREVSAKGLDALIARLNKIKR